MKLSVCLVIVIICNLVNYANSEKGDQCTIPEFRSTSEKIESSASYDSDIQIEQFPFLGSYGFYAQRNLVRK